MIRAQKPDFSTLYWVHLILSIVVLSSPSLSVISLDLALWDLIRGKSSSEHSIELSRPSAQLPFNLVCKERNKFPEKSPLMLLYIYTSFPWRYLRKQCLLHFLQKVFHHHTKVCFLKFTQKFVWGFYWGRNAQIQKNSGVLKAAESGNFETVKYDFVANLATKT